MIYFRNNGNVIEKYEVLFDRESLLNFRQKVIHKCGEVHKMHEELNPSRFISGGYKYLDEESWANHSMNVSVIYYEDIKKRKSGNKGTEWDHYDSYEVDLYYFDYTKYVCPYLVYFIDEFLRGNEKCVNALFNKDFSSIKKFPTVLEKISGLERKLLSCESSYEKSKSKKLEELNSRYKSFNERNASISDNYRELQKLIEKIQKELTKMDNKNKQEIEKIQKELSELQEIKEYNLDQKPSKEYFDKLSSIIEFRLVDKLDISEVERVNTFYNSKVINPSMRLLLDKK